MYERWEALAQAWYRRAALLAAEDADGPTDAQRATLRAVGVGAEPRETVLQDENLRSFVEPFLDRAENEIRQQEARRLGIEAFRRTAWAVFRDTVCNAAAEVNAGLFVSVYEDMRNDLCTKYGRWLSRREGERNEQFDSAIKLLESENFVAVLLRELWKQCPEECKDIGLPDPPCDLRKESAQPGKPQPAWQRLRIILQSGGNDLAELDGKEYRLTAPAAKFLQALQISQGNMVLGTTLKTTCGDRADRMHQSLPDKLRAIVEKPGKGNQGYRML